MSPRQSGFSLIELMVAMLITLIVTGAIYGLMATGQSAFRREPELSDRQQNIRAAMDVIMRDVERAGMGLPAFTQVFGTGLDGGGANPDKLEIMAGVDSCPAAAICKFSVGGPNGTYELPVAQQAGSACPGLPRLVAITPGPTATPNKELFVIGMSAVPATPGTTCVAPLNNGLTAGAGGSTVGMSVVVPINQGPVDWRPPGPATLDIDQNNPQLLVPVDVVRYEIAPDTSDLADSTVPCLWRSVTGGRDASDGFATVKPPGPGGPWQMVARGVEDLQVTYSAVNPAAPVTSVNAPVVALNNFATLVFDVQVTLSARVTAQNLQGETVAFGTRRVRGQLTSSAAPRAALTAFAQAGSTSLWN
jgi:prepilin-type N-terminal cleavage/methylation domain-containing protein